MNFHRVLIAAVLLCGLAGIAACDENQGATGTATAGSHSMLGDTVAKAMDEARQKLRTENIEISSGHVEFSSTHVPGRQNAEISPQGDLLIDGRSIAVTPQQRALLLDYRSQVIGVAEAGMDIGTQGVDIASQALGAVFSGQSKQQLDSQLHAKDSAIKQSAAKLCARLPAMRETQQQLAATLPAFKPYATMTQKDIDDCQEEVRKNHFDFHM